MLYLFDLDNTLISGYMDNPDKAYHTWQLLPGRQEKIGRLAKQHHIGIVTNQGGAAFGLTTEQDFIKKVGRVAMALGFGAVQINDGRSDGPLYVGPSGLYLPVYVCYSDSRAKDSRYATPEDVARRKPSGAMIREAMTHLDHGPTDTLFIGDRPEDEKAAGHAGVAFRWAEEFFQ